MALSAIASGARGGLAGTGAGADTIGGLLAFHARTIPAAPALLAPGQPPLTYGALGARIEHLVETLRDVDPSSVTVEEAMSEHVYAVDPDTSLDVVAESLAEHKYGSAVVMQNGKVVGIFTTNDACRALAELLHSRLAK